jgi:hypothetical protein
MIQKLQQLPIPLRILAYAAAAAAVFVLAAGVGVVAALTLGSDGGSPEGAKPERTAGAKPERTAGANPGQGGKSEEDAEGGASAASSTAAYSNSVAGVQNGSVKASLRSNEKLLRYDRLTPDDVEELKANYVALEAYARRAKDLAAPAEYEDQYGVFVRAIDELRDADELAYRLAADPSSATQTDFEAYDRHVHRATAYLRRSNEMLGKNHKTTKAAQEVSLG